MTGTPNLTSPHNFVRGDLPGCAICGVAQAIHSRTYNVDELIADLDADNEALREALQEALEIITRALR